MSSTGSACKQSSYIYNVLINNTDSIKRLEYGCLAMIFIQEQNNLFYVIYIMTKEYIYTDINFTTKEPVSIYV